MKNIAVFTGSEGKTIPIDMDGDFLIFKKVDGKWKVIDTIAFSMDKTGGMAGLRKQLKDLGQQLKCCGNIVASKITGLPYTVLDPLGFELWEIEGLAETFLEEIVMENAAIDSEDVADETLKPMKIDDQGRYYFDMKGLLKKLKGSKSSKELLIPFFETVDFTELKVLCGHVPPWFEKKLSAYKLTYEVNDRGQGEFTVIIRKVV